MVARFIPRANMCHGGMGGRQGEVYRRRAIAIGLARAVPSIEIPYALSQTTWEARARTGTNPVHGHSTRGRMSMIGDAHYVARSRIDQLHSHPILHDEPDR